MQISTTLRSITSEAAHALIAAAEAKAREIGVPMVITVVDEGGTLKAFSRMDGTAVIPVTVSQDKAYSAVIFRRPTHEMAEGLANNPAFREVVMRMPRLILLGGGFPIMDGEAVVGGVGVSGGRPAQDMEVAQAGLAALT